MQKIRSFEPKIRFTVESDTFRIKTVDNPLELEETLRLRHEVFDRETLNRRQLSNLDFDRFDLICDHLIVLDRSSGQILGTSRVNCTRFSDQFYTATEFNIDRIMELDGIKLELGRTCIAKEHRTGIVINLLWRGLAQYIKETQADYLFGCASIWSEANYELAVIYKFLKDSGYTTEQEIAFPVGKYLDPTFAPCLEYLSRPEFTLNTASVQKELPTLVKSYLKMGAKICGHPALDQDFQCYDLVTLQEMKRLTRIFERKYGVW